MNPLQQPTESGAGLYERYTSTSSLAGVDVEQVLQWNYGYFIEHFERYLPLDHNARILDLGCGYGKNLLNLEKLGYGKCNGVDISREQIDFAKRHLRLSNVECADAHEWLIGKECQFDLILTMDVLEHLPLEALIELGCKINAALKPEGMLIVQVPNGMSPLNPFIYGDLTHVRAFTPQSLQQFFLNTGFEPVKYEEALEHSYNLQSFLKRLVWKSVLHPLLHLFARFAHGNVFGGGIYTANLIAIARKPGEKP